MDIVYILAYLAAAFLSLKSADLSRRSIFLTVSNLAGCYLIFFRDDSRGAADFAFYVAWVMAVHLLSKRGANSSAGHALYFTALFSPVLFLMLIEAQVIPKWPGIPFMALRLSYLTYESRIGKFEFPSLVNYLGFAFFPPTFLLGPMSPYGMYLDSVREPRAPRPAWSAWRMLAGSVKLFLGIKIDPFTFPWHELHGKGWNDFASSCAASYLYFYLIFSGTCDLGIAFSDILGVRVMENFDWPLLSRNIQEFWKRFHITMYHYVRDVVFVPLSLSFARVLGPARARHGTALALFLSMILVAFWHRIGWNALALGVLHGAGLASFYYLSLRIRKLPPHLRSVIAESRVLLVLSTAATFAYVSFSMFFFQNSAEEIAAIARELFAPR
jgi:alginate O-acetyltransferase complex protein AlgI